MVAYYQIAGKQVGSHVLAMATLGSIFGGTFLATRGGGKQPQNQGAQQGPPVTAGSKDEEKFIQDFLNSAGGSGEKSTQ